MRAESKDSRVQASHVLKSFLGALEIPYVQDVEGLKIKSRSGSDIHINVGSGRINTATASTVEVNADDLISPEVTRILAALHTVTDTAGYGKPNPLHEEIKAGDHRVSYHDDYEHVYLRLRLLSRTPRPSPSQMEQLTDTYLPYIKRAAAKAMYRFKYVFSGMGHEEQDLVNVGLAHAVAFVHNYAYDTEPVNNIKLLTEFLNQRFAEMAKVTNKKGASASVNAIKHIGPTHEGQASDDFDQYAEFMVDETSDPVADEEYTEGEYYLRSQDGRQRNLTVKSDGFLGVDMYLDGRFLTSSEQEVLRDRVSAGQLTLVPVPSSTEEDVQVSLPSANVRKQRARDELLKRLDSMPQEQRETVLAYAALSRDYCPDARAAARKLCEEVACPQCKRKIISGTQCTKCGLQAQPRYGVDYLGYRAKLRTEHHLMAEAMTAAIPDSELRAKKRKALTPEEKSVEVAAPAVPALPQEEIKKLAEKLRDECFESLPHKLTCTKCKQELPKASFGVRVPRRKSDGMPMKASRIPWCKPCRKGN
jgi:hypothetical protein